MRPTLTAMIIATLLAPATTGATADLSGKWTLNGDVQGNPVNLDCAFTEASDTKLAGRCQVNGIQAVDVSGAVTGAAVEFSFTVAGYTLNYRGKLDGDNMAGAIEVAGASGAFSGSRAKG
jgi:hypothetical protein